MKFENVKITSYLDYDIGKLLQKKIEDAKPKNWNEKYINKSKWVIYIYINLK